MAQLSKSCASTLKLAQPRPTPSAILARISAQAVQRRLDDDTIEDIDINGCDEVRISR